MSAYYHKKELKIEDVKISDLIKKYDTPFYVYSTTKIIDEYNNLRNSLKRNIFYSVKANSNQSIISIFKNLDAGFDVVSGEELKRVITAKVKPNKIIFEGVGKSKKDIIFAINNNIKQINIESIEELSLINSIANSLNKKVRIGIRINPNINAKTNRKISTGRKKDKFGIDFFDITKVIRRIHLLNNISLRGISCHIGSQIFSLDVYEKTFKKMLLALEIFKKNNFPINHINLGGGMGVDYSNKKVFKINNFVKLINSYFDKNIYDISFEPGRFLVAKSGTLVTKTLITKKTGGQNFIIVDAGMNTFIRPALYNSFHNFLPMIKKTNNTYYTIGGPICESSDIFVKRIYLPKQSIGDVLAIQDVGAYGFVMSSNYNSKILPAEILIKDNKHQLIRPAQMVEELISRDIVPKWIKNIS